jgi:hypothetical protein
VSPKQGDILLRGSRELGFELLDGITEQTLAGAMDFDDAVEVALSMTPGDLWQQDVDAGGAPLGPPSLLLRNTHI